MDTCYMGRVDGGSCVCSGNTTIQYTIQPICGRSKLTYTSCVHNVPRDCSFDRNLYVERGETKMAMGE